MVGAARPTSIALTLAASVSAELIYNAIELLVSVVRKTEGTS